MLRLLNVARPFTAATGVDPDRVPLLGLVPIAIATALVAVVTRFPPASRISTCTPGVMFAPPVVFAGCTRKPSLAAGPTVTFKGFDVVPVRPDADAVSV